MLQFSIYDMFGGESVPKNNDNTRLEMLIVLDYLLKFTDEKHLSSRNKIAEYALSKYEYKISKPQRISICLEQLEMFSNDYPDILRFEIKAVSSGVRTKYYANSFLPRRRIEELMRAIYDSRKITYTNKLTILDEIKKVFLSEYEEEKYDNISMYNSIGTKYNELVRKCEIILKEQNEFRFSLKNWEDSVSYKSYLYYDNNMKDISYVGKIKKIKENLGNHYLVIFVLDRQDIISIPIENLIVKEVYPADEQFYEEKSIPLHLGKYIDLEELIDDFFDRKIEDEVNIHFSFVNSFYIYSKIKKNYELFFKEGFIEDGETEDKIYASVFSTPKLFCNWLKTFSLENDIAIIDNEIKEKIVKMYEESIRSIKNN